MSTIFGSISVETPQFTLVATHGAVEIRRYARQLRAVVEYGAEGPMGDGLNTPFSALAGYIFGGNTKRATLSSGPAGMPAPVVVQREESEKVAMTAPVVMRREEAAGKRTMAFILPSKYKSAEELPVPKDAKVSIVEVPERTLAAITFSGSLASASHVEGQERQLRATCAEKGIKLSTVPTDVQYGAYNPPWCLPFLRTNELLVPVLGEDAVAPAASS